MTRLYDVARSVVEGSVEAGTQRVENIHGRITDYAKSRLPVGKESALDAEPDSIYQVIRDVTHELSALADDLVDLAEDAHHTLKKKPNQASRENLDDKS